MAAVDPGALYTQTLADLGLQEGQTLGRIEEGEGNLRTNVGSGESQISLQEPGTYKTESNRANKGGILNSGVNSARKTTIANAFAGRRTANENRLKQGLATFKRDREEAATKKTLGEHTAAQQKAEREDALRAQNPVVPVETTQPTTATSTAGGPPRIVGVKQQPTTGGSIQWSRKAAVRALQAKRGY